MRMFEEHRIRKTVSLNGLWDFFAKKTGTVKMNVPGCWETVPGFEAYRGKAEYKRTIELSRSTNLRLVFKGVSHTADVYFDGEFVKHHYNAYTPFDCIIKNADSGEHEITVKVSNEFDESSSLHVPNDYYSYGGISRPAGMEMLSDVYIKSVHFVPLYKSIWQGRAEAVIVNLSDEEKSCEVKISLCGKDKALSVMLMPNEEKTLVWEESFPDAECWSVENPKLYFIDCLLTGDGVIDDLRDRIGFRKIEAKDGKLLLNGEKLFLKGFNRHEDYTGVGCSLPEALMMRDIQIMQDVGANAVRTSHYPNDERFLDMCDEMGMLVWEEHHARGLRLKEMEHPNFDEQCRDCTYEMINSHINHPSIIMWAIFNECASDTEVGRVKYERLYKQIRSLDTSRPCTSASDRHITDICLEYPDIVSYNIYSGWYDMNPIDETLDKYLGYVYTHGGKDKPFIVSEFGAAAMYGFRDEGHRKWSEEKQAEIIGDTLKVYMNDDRVSGVFVWQFCDCRVTEEGNWFMSRACMRNNKGVVDTYRRPKLAYNRIKQMWK